MPRIVVTLCRFGLGTAAGALAGLAVFRGAIFQPADPAFDCLAVGALLAGLAAFVRLGRPGQALVLALAFASLRAGLAPERGVATVLEAVLLGLGTLLVAILYDLLARDGLRFGKFLVMGPLLGGIYFAVTPIARFGDLTPTGAADTLLFQLFLGLVIGDGVGLGLELAELLPLGAPVPAPLVARLAPAVLEGAGEERSSSGE